MASLETLARAMAQADDVDPDQPLKGFRRIIGKTLQVFRYDPRRPAWTYYVPMAKVLMAASKAMEEPDA